MITAPLDLDAMLKHTELMLNFWDRASQAADRIRARNRQPVPEGLTQVQRTALFDGRVDDSKVIECAAKVPELVEKLTAALTEVHQLREEAKRYEGR